MSCKENLDFNSWMNKYGNQETGHVSSTTSSELFNKEHQEDDKNKNKIILKKINTINTNFEPKHISIYNNNIFISCMSGKCIMHFKLNNEQLNLCKIFNTDLQCIHSTAYNDYLFFTESDLNKDSKNQDYLCVYSLNNNKLINKIHTGGKWSKYIKIIPTKNLLIITNWFSNNLSIFDITDIESPKLIQILNCGISPRGLDFNKNNSKGYVACYYSRNIIEFNIEKNPMAITWISEPYDYPHYSGNFRDIYVEEENAYLTNMGRNKLVCFDVIRKEYKNSLTIGEFPNSLIKYKEYLLVTCAKSNLIYVINPKKMKIIGVSEYTSEYPVGLATYEDLIFTTSFKENKLEIWKF